MPSRHLQSLQLLLQCLYLRVEIKLFFWHSSCSYNYYPRITSESDMNLIRIFITALLLVLSGQSQALFMPTGFQISADITDVSSDAGC